MTDPHLGPTLWVKKEKEEYRNAYLKFELPEKGTVFKALLRLYVDALDSNTSSYEIELQGVDDEQWNEETLVFTNQPGTATGVYTDSDKGAVIGMKTVNEAGVFLTFDVTEFVRSQDDGIATFRIVGVTNSRGARYASSNYTDESKRPTLTIIPLADASDPEDPGPEPEEPGELKIKRPDFKDAQL